MNLINKLREMHGTDGNEYFKEIMVEIGPELLDLWRVNKRFRFGFCEKEEVIEVLKKLNAKAKERENVLNEEN